MAGGVIEITLVLISLPNSACSMSLYITKPKHRCGERVILFLIQSVFNNESIVGLACFQLVLGADDVNTQKWFL